MRPFRREKGVQTMASNQKQTTDALRAEWTEKLMAYVYAHDTDVCQTAAGTLMIPTVDSEGEDRWVKFSIIIPKEASEEEGTDGYALAHEYQLKLETAAARKQKAAEKSAKAKENAKNVE